MATTEWGFNVSPSGTTLSTSNIANDGATQNASVVSPGSGGTIVSSNTHALEGGLSLKSTGGGAGAGPTTRLPLPSSSLTGGHRFYVYKDTAFGATTDIWIPRVDGSTIAFRVGVDSSGRCFVRPAAGGAVIAQTATGAFVAGRLNRFELTYTIATSTTGSFTLNVYTGQNTAAAGTCTSSAANLGTAAATLVDFGTPADGTTTYALWFDRIALSDAASSPGRYTTGTSPVYPADVTTNSGAWTYTGGGSSLEQSLGDGSDSTYILNPGSTTGEVITLLLAPLSSGNVVVSARVALDTGQPNGDVRCELLQGASTVVATWTQTIVSTTFTDVSHTLSSGELAAVTDRADLRLRITANPGA